MESCPALRDEPVANVARYDELMTFQQEVGHDH